MKQATFRIIYYPKVERYTALAWNYDQAVLLGTSDFATYGEARAALETLAKQHGVELRWFDGEYSVAGHGEQLIPREER